ncbi:hypothetical protein ABMA10_04050 [Plantibacter sp. RU18]
MLSDTSWSDGLVQGLDLSDHTTALSDALRSYTVKPRGVV